MWDGMARRAFGFGGGGAPGMAAADATVTLAEPAAVSPAPLTERELKAERDPRAEREPKSRMRIGLALGGGAARGWAHIGVLRVLAQAGIRIDVIAGSSIGAVVGGCHAAGKLDELERFARALTKTRVLTLLDFHLGSGLIAGDRVRTLLERELADERLETLPVRFAAVATELGTGHEYWLTRGPLVRAMRASYALPGVIDPVKLGGRWLMDGALVNPIPITTARALGADLVICVNLNGDVRLRGTIIQSHGTEDDDEIVEAVLDEPRRTGLFAPVLHAAERVRAARRKPAEGPGIATVMIDAFNITQDRIARSRLAGDPPDVMICPKLSTVGLFEFHRAAETIDLGRQAAERALPDLQELMRDLNRAG